MSVIFGVRLQYPSLSKNCGLHVAKTNKTLYFQRTYADFSRKRGIAVAFRLWKPHISCIVFDVA